VSDGELDRILVIVISIGLHPPADGWRCQAIGHPTTPEAMTAGREGVHPTPVRRAFDPTDVGSDVHHDAGARDRIDG